MNVVKSRGYIKKGGCGGFLNPPSHPEHSYHVAGYVPENFLYSLSSAAECEWLEEGVRGKCREMLDQWEQEKPAIDHPALQDWVKQVLGYFSNCYRGKGEEPECWHAGKMTIYEKHTPAAMERITLAISSAVWQEKTQEEIAEIRRNAERAERLRYALENADDHAGVHYIREFYPDFVPTADHFDGAYWGKARVG